MGKLWRRLTDCVQRTNIQNLKAIHNRVRKREFASTLCSKNEYTKSESNSQQATGSDLTNADCVQRTNIQNLKAIHNRLQGTTTEEVIVFKERIYKI